MHCSINPEPSPSAVTPVETKPRRKRFTSTTTDAMLRSMKGDQATQSPSVSRSTFNVVTTEKKSDEDAQEFKQEILKKEFQNPSKKTIIRSAFLGDIREASHERELLQIGSMQKRTLEKITAPVMELQQIPGSRNPVGRVLAACYISVDKLRSLPLFSFDTSWSSISAIILEFFKTATMKEEIESEWSMFLDSAKNIYETSEGTTEEKFKLVMTCLEEKITHLRISFSENDLLSFTSLKDYLKKASEPIPSDVTIHYSREELISYLMTLKAYVEENSPLEVRRSTSSEPPPFKDLDLTPDQINALVQDLRLSPDYVEDSVLSSLFTKHKFPEEVQHSTQGHLQDYISSYDLIVHSQDHLDLAGILEEIPDLRHMDRTGHVVKLGDENIRELLAQKFLASLGLADHVVTKVKADLPVKIGLTNASKGLIGGKWLTDAKPLSTQLVTKLIKDAWTLEKSRKNLVFIEACIQTLRSKRNLDAKSKIRLNRLGINTNPSFLAKGLMEARLTYIELIKPLEECVVKSERLLISSLDLMQEALEETKGAFKRGDASTKERILQRLKETGGVLHNNFEEAVQEHALIDILFCSYDSHLNQYLVKDGVPHCIDFARFLPPSSIYLKNGVARATFRSIFFNLPSSKRPLSQRLIQKILSWDIEELEKYYRENDLIGDPDSFQKGNEEMKPILAHQFELNGLLQAFKSKDPAALMNIHMKCQELREIYHDLSLEGSVLDQAFQAMQFLKIERSRVCSEPFAQIHPKAFEDFKRRLLSMQDYVGKKTQPTIYEAFHILYPELSPFMHALSQWEPMPGFYISLTDKLDPLSLEQIVSKTLQLDKQEGTKLEGYLEQIRPLTIPSNELALTMSLG